MGGFSLWDCSCFLGNFFFSIMSCLASGYYNIFDTQCGYTAIDRKTLKKLNLDELYPRYGFPTDLLAKLNMIAAKVLDVRVRAIYKDEKSGIKVFPYILTIISLTLKLFFLRQLRKLRQILLYKLDVSIFSDLKNFLVKNCN